MAKYEEELLAVEANIKARNDKKKQRLSGEGQDNFVEASNTDNDQQHDSTSNEDTEEIKKPESLAAVLARRRAEAAQRAASAKEGLSSDVELDVDGSDNENSNDDGLHVSDEPVVVMEEEEIAEAATPLKSETILDSENTETETGKSSPNESSSVTAKVPDQHTSRSAANIKTAETGHTGNVPTNTEQVTNQSKHPMKTDKFIQQHGQCRDDMTFRDAKGKGCSAWSGIAYVV